MGNGVYDEGVDSMLFGERQGFEDLFVGIVLGGEVVDLVGLDELQEPPQGRPVRQIAILEKLP